MHTDQHLFIRSFRSIWVLTSFVLGSSSIRVSPRSYRSIPLLLTFFGILIMHLRISPLYYKMEQVFRLSYLNPLQYHHIWVLWPYKWQQYQQFFDTLLHTYKVKHSPSGDTLSTFTPRWLLYLSDEHVPACSAKWPSLLQPSEVHFTPWQVQIINKTRQLFNSKQLIEPVPVPPCWHIYSPHLFNHNFSIFHDDSTIYRWWQAWQALSILYVTWALT